VRLRAGQEQEANRAVDALLRGLGDGASGGEVARLCAQGLYWLEQVSVGLGELDFAIGVRNRIAGYFPTTPEARLATSLAASARYARGMEHYKGGEFAIAAQQLEVAAEQGLNRRDRFAALQSAGLSYLAQGELEKALALLKLARDADASQALRLGVSYQIGLCEFNSGDFTGAREEFRRYLRDAPDAPGAEAARDYLQRCEEELRESSGAGQ
jgi:tetratricopeptide (TPR) repeat protein